MVKKPQKSFRRTALEVTGYGLLGLAVGYAGELVLALALGSPGSIISMIAIAAVGIAYARDPDTRINTLSFVPMALLGLGMASGQLPLPGFLSFLPTSPELLGQSVRHSRLH